MISGVFFIVLFTKPDHSCSPSSVFVILGRIMLSCSIYILVTENIGNHIDIPGFLIEIGTKGTAKLMGRDFLEGRYVPCVLLYQIFHSPYRDTLILER